MRYLTLFLVAGLSLFAGCDRSIETSAKMNAGVVGNDSFSLSHGNLILQQNQPGIAFSFVKTPGRQKEFTYFTVFNHEFPNLNKLSSRSRADSSDGNCALSFSAFGNECLIEYSVTLNPDDRNIKQETTSIAGRDYDQKKGRVFLIDMKTTPVTIEQLDVELPTEIPDLKDTNTMDEFGQQTLQTLRKADVRLEEFFQSNKK